MTSPINPINVNASGISGSFGFGSKPKKEAEETVEEKVAPAPQSKEQLSADAILDYMAQSAVAPRQTVDTSKYVDSESADRIAGFMSQFEDIVAQNLTVISQDFPEMSDSAKQALALAQVEKQV